MRTFVRLSATAILVCAASICVPNYLFAQGYGSISGTVADSTGAIIPGAAVTATQVGTGLELKTTTTSDGTFLFSSLAPSVYDIYAGHPGFEVYTEKSLPVRADAAV